MVENVLNLPTQLLDDCYQKQLRFVPMSVHVKFSDPKPALKIKHKPKQALYLFGTPKNKEILEVSLDDCSVNSLETPASMTLQYGMGVVQILD